VSLSWLAHSPGPLHKGNVTGLTIIDEKATGSQREALARMAEGKSGGPWVIFSAVTATSLGPKFAAFDVHPRDSTAAYVCGDLRVELGPILNPVTGEAERSISISLRVSRPNVSP